MRFHVVGLGSIGCMVAFHLRRSLNMTHEISAVHRLSKNSEMARKSGGAIKVEHQGVVLSALGLRHEAFETYTSDPLPAGVKAHKSTIRKATTIEAEFIDTLIVTTKAHTSLSVLRDLTPRLTANSTIVLLHNGMGVYERIVTDLFPNPAARPHVVVGVNTHGCWTKSYLHVVHAGVGNISLGIMPDGRNRDFEASAQISPETGLLSLNLDDITPSTEDPEHARYSSLRNTITAFTQAEGLNATWQPFYDVQLAMRRKLVVNCVINPLTAILGCKNGVVLSHKEGIHLCRGVCQEASAAFQAQWRDERNDIPAGEVSAFPRALAAQALEQECIDVAEKTKNNFSSMLMDLKLSRPTELEYLTGYLLGLGRQYSVPMPTNKAIWNLVRLRCNIPIDTV